MYQSMYSTYVCIKTCMYIEVYLCVLRGMCVYKVHVYDQEEYMCKQMKNYACAIYALLHYKPRDRIIHQWLFLLIQFPGLVFRFNLLSPSSPFLLSYA